MSYKTVRMLLEQRLANLPSGLPTAWENTAYDPVVGTPYQRASLLPAQTEQPTLGDGFRREVGLMQVSLYFPENEGPGAAMTQAEAIREHFARGTTLINGSVRVVIERTPSIGLAFPDGGFYALPVSIDFFADVSN